MGMKLSFSLLKASSQVLLGLKYLEKAFSRAFYKETGADFALSGCCIQNWAYLLRYKSIKVSKLDIIRKKKDCIFR